MSRLIAKTDVTYALGYSPYDASNPLGFSTLVQMTSALTGYATVASVTAQIAAVAAGTTSQTGGPILVPNTLTPRRVDARFGDMLNVRDFGAIGDGSADDGAAFSACAVAGATFGKDMQVPAGTYRIVGSGGFVLRPGVAVYMNRRAVLLVEAGTTGQADVITNVGLAGDYAIYGGTIKGQADSIHTEGPHNLVIYNAGRVILQGVASRYSRLFGFSLQRNQSVLADGVHVFRSMRDGLAAWDTHDVQVVNSRFEQVNDDAVSAHTNDATAAPPRASVIVANNDFSESQGVSILGAKAVTITGNTMRRMMSYGVYVGASPYFLQGNTPAFAVKITGNTILDVFKRSEPTPANQLQSYIIIAGGPRRGAGAAAAPGDPGTPLIGSGLGNLYVQGTDTATVATPGNRWLDISGNTLARTLPACTNYADWGYGFDLWVGAQTATNTYNGGIPEANLATNGITLSGTVRNSRIADNLIETTGPYSIFLAGPFAENDLDGLSITGNGLTNFSAGGVALAGNIQPTYQRLRIADNVIDGDPGYGHPIRTPADGTWKAAGNPIALATGVLSGATIERNTIRNVAAATNQVVGFNVIRDNLLYCAPAVYGAFNTGNGGIGFPLFASLAWRPVTEDGNPGSVTYGRVLAMADPVVIKPAGVLPAAPATVSDVAAILRVAGLCA